MKGLMTWVCQKRLYQFVLLLLSIGILGFAGYLQWTEALIPCPLCMMQRGMNTALIVLALIGSLIGLKLSRKGWLTLLLIEWFIAFGGGFFALRQLWLERLPIPDTGMCMPHMALLINKLPWHEVVYAFIWGGRQTCGEVTWLFLGFSMAMWSFVFFLIVMTIITMSFLCYIQNEKST